ncbi:hypothetical protein TraAM80_07317 [Trypanosoma rangeli]|uniref:Guanine nucleotide-binding protein subunit beta-like protein n=1 Tax=Trypanosoma rangeli TaxID=5698 RepID=A0A422N658_TRYRA|nr:uncharacterized protein TraAM80_07317 [Trypanosoma rangeli]RNF00926.1 hypothetical protein TraAM80_07317 [Trypanosoma rangeli]|eukprot:RNF00926.1 hypothetical protein TraAM80_07317 [Trypanosoma rangeli]
MPHSAASELYEECCALYGVRPNRDVAQQLDRPNFLTIREIDASRTFLGELGVRALLEFVGSHAGIQRLVLTKNGVDAACVEHLCSVLRESPSLSSVDLSDNRMSTPSVRLLWETVRAVPHLQEVNLENCGVSEDWVNRLGRCCKANSELQQLGFHPYGPERSLRSWETVLVLVLGPEPLVEAYCREILPYVRSFVSRLRLRIAPLTIEKTDTHDVVRSKVWRCRSAYNCTLSWCVVLIDEATSWMDPDISALTAVLQQEEPVIPPLRNKFGVLRDPMHRCARHLFVYTLPYLHGEGLDGGGYVLTVPSSVWLSSVGISVPDDVRVPSAVALPSKRSWKIRCPSDLCTALYAVFSEQPRSMTLLEKNEETDEKVWETVERDKHFGSLHPRCKDIVHYMETPAGQLSVPLILYGPGGVGMPKIVSWAAATYAAVGSLRVVPYHVGCGNESLVVLLFHLLRVFSKKQRRVYRTVEELSLDVRETISAYDGQMVLLLISSIDHLDLCGCRESAVLEWLPASLPPSVRVIASLNTESPLLIALRKRMPQPYEVLITSLPKQVRVDLFLQELLRRDVLGKSTEAHSLNGSSPTQQLDGLKSLEKAFLMKDGSESASFGIYTASFLQRLPEDLLERDTAFLIAEEVPDTLDEVITQLLRRYESLSDTLTVQFLTMGLAAAPLPISEIIYICEELGPCARHKTLPVLLMMSDDGLLTLTSDSIVHLSDSDVRRVVLKLYADMQDTLSVLVETHLFRLVKTRSPDMSFCFRHLASIMIANGSLDAAYGLVLNPTHMDALLSRDVENCTYAIDLVIRLLNTHQLLLELDEGGSCSIKSNIDLLNRGALQSALEALQSYDGCFFQAALLASDVSPYQTRAMEAKEVPYTVLVPLNRGDEDDATHSLECKHMPVYCHLWGEYLVVTTTQEVIVYSATDFESELARSFLPFESNQNLCGSLVAAGSRVVVIGDGQLLLWDFASQSFTMFEDTTSSLNENALDSFGLSLLVRHPSKEQFSIIDVSKKKVVMELPIFETPVREALFCGSGILARALYDLFLMREEEEEVMKLAHTGTIRGVSFSNDSRLIASCVRESIWIWSGTGELLHLIDAGLTPVEDIRFNASGALLLSWQSEGVKVWNSLNGDCAGTVELCFDERASFLCFTEDGSNIIGRCGPRIYLWDVHTRQPVGVLTASTGHFTFVQERNQVVIGTTSKKEVKIWRVGDAPIPSIQRVREKRLTSMWRKNARLSTAPIIGVSVNLNGTLLTAVDDNGSVILQPMDGSVRWDCNVSNVESAAIMTDMLLFTVKGESHRFFWKRLSEDDTVNEVLLPRDAASNATLDLKTAEFGNSIAVVSNSEERTLIYVYNAFDWNLTNQFLGHSGRIVQAFFAGDFLFSLGVDCTVRLWSLLRHAERALYTHTCAIVAAAPGPLMTLFFVDEQSRVYHVHVDNIASSTHARFVAEAVELTLTIPTTVRVRHVIHASNLLAMSSEDGSVYLVDLHHGGTVVRLSDYKCLSLAFVVDGSDVHIVTGHSTGEVVLHLVRFTEPM